MWNALCFHIPLGFSLSLSNLSSIFRCSLSESIPMLLRFLHPDAFYRDYRKRNLQQSHHKTVCHPEHAFCSCHPEHAFREGSPKLHRFKNLDLYSLRSHEISLSVRIDKPKPCCHPEHAFREGSPKITLL